MGGLTADQVTAMFEVDSECLNPLISKRTFNSFASVFISL
jgi:hypothetical protein